MVLRMPGVGDLVGKYRVLAQIGEGGMGTVYRAENTMTGKRVALKWMHPRVAGNANSAARFLREAQAASRLSHPNVVDVYDIVQDGATLFLVMELLEGETLRAYLARNLQPTINELLALLIPALEGVAAAHEQGVVHRDLKPDNIFLERSRGKLVPKVVDFGVAKLAETDALGITSTGVPVGTPLYMSLEQLRGDRDVDGRADVYAFGVMLYEAIAGQVPYRASTLPELAIKLATGEPPDIKSIRPDLPTPLARLLHWAIAREREQRVPDINTLIRELEPFCTEHGFRAEMTDPEGKLPRLGIRSSAPVAGSAPTSATSPDGPDTLNARELALARTQRRRPRPAWATSALLIALPLISGLLWLARDAAAPTETTSQPPPAAVHATEVAPVAPPVAPAQEARDSEQNAAAAVPEQPPVAHAPEPQQPASVAPPAATRPRVAAARRRSDAAAKNVRPPAPEAASETPPAAAPIPVTPAAAKKSASGVLGF